MILAPLCIFLVSAGGGGGEGEGEERVQKTHRVTRGMRKKLCDLPAVLYLWFAE